MQSITVQSVLSPKSHILPATATCMLSLAGPHWLQVIYKSLLGKAPPYLSSLQELPHPRPQGPPVGGEDGPVHHWDRASTYPGHILDTVPEEGKQHHQGVDVSV